MKKYRDLSINLKLPLTIGFASLLSLALICILLMSPLRTMSFEDSTEIARLSAEDAGYRLSERINAAASVVRAYSGIIELIAETDIVPTERKRELLLAEMEVMLNKEKQLGNLWCSLEPNALDGMDDFFRDTRGSDANGVFVPWFADGILEEVTTEQDVTADYYAIPKATGREMITEPYWEDVNGEQIHMFSISVPIMVNGTFIGVIGTDFYADELGEMINDLDRNATGKLVTDMGTVAVYHDPSRIGLTAEYGNREILDRLPEGKMFDGIYNFEGQDVYKVYVPVQFGVGTNPWFYAVDVPLTEIYSKSEKTTIYLIAYCLAGVIIITLAGWLLILPLLKNITGITGVIEKLSLGLINLDIDEQRSKDEIGTMKNKLKRLVDGLKNTANFAQNVGQGNFNVEYQLMSDGDVLGNSLLDMSRSLQEAANLQAVREKEEKQRSWGTTGLAKFAEILRQDNDNMEALAYNVISNMVKYLDANQGGMFILNEAENEEDKVLELKACYAFDRKKFTEKEIQPGEGLVGACFLEGEPIYVTDVPDSYVNITSGLGKANPTSVLISPLKVNDQIYGVLEIASFKEIEPYQLEFVQKVGESIASTISTVRVNIRTTKLLERTSIQAEEMANQEEELRQNMEEMQATQEESRRREVELQETVSKMREVQAIDEENQYEMQQFRDAIFDTFSIYEFSPDGYITAINDSFLKLFGVERSAFIGKHDSEFISKEEYDLAWGAVARREIWDSIQKVEVEGKIKDFHHRYIPISNKKGELLRVLVFSFMEND